MAKTEEPMNKHPFISMLTTNRDLWCVPLQLDPLDPCWEEEWENASGIQKKNLARGWVWSTLSFHNAVDVLDEKLEFVQKIQSYLDPRFFSSAAHNVKWTSFSCLLGFDTVQDADEFDARSLSDMRFLHTYFFGSKSEQHASLLALQEMDENTCYGCYNAASRQAWRIYDNNPDELLSAACYVSYMAGRNSEEPGASLPLLAKITQALGVYDAHGVNQSNPLKESYPIDVLKSQVNALPPKIAATLLKQSVKNDIIVYDNAEYVAGGSFLIHQLKTSDPFGMLKEWIPEKKEAFTTAESIGLGALDALTLISEESVTPGTSSQLLSGMDINL